MWYAPFLRARKALQIYFTIVLGALVLGLVVRFWPGNVHMSAHDVEAMRLLRIDGWLYLFGACVSTVILATILGLNLASENDGHLELAWTRPISREGYALTIFGVDLVAIYVAIVMTALAAIVATDIAIGHQDVVFAGSWTNGVHTESVGVGAQKITRVVNEQPIDVPKEALRFLAFSTFPVCIYAWITALSASLKRNRGTIAGVFWPAILILGAVENVPIQPIHALMHAINTVNPLVIYTTKNADLQTSSELIGMLSILVLLSLTVVQWRRLEA
jgi:hypothetical protein